MKTFALGLFLGFLAIPAIASSDGTGSRYFDPLKIATWTTCIQNNSGQGGAEVCAPGGTVDRLTRYTSTQAGK